MLNVLYIATHQAWPANSGIRVRDYHLAKHLGTHCRVSFVEFLHPSDDASIRPPMEAGFHEVYPLRRNLKPYSPGIILRGFMGPIPLTVLNYWSDELARQLEGILREGNFDSVQLESIHLWPYAPVVRNAPSRPSLVHDYHDVQSDLMKRYADAASNPLKRLVAYRTAHLLRKMEEDANVNCDALTVVSERDREEVLRQSPGANVHSVPNGVDCPYYDGCYEAQTAGSAKPNKLLFVGSMEAHANIDAMHYFMRTAWPLFESRFPDLEFYVVGKNPHPSVQAYASERIKVTGTVPDVRPFYDEAVAMIVPIRVAGGTRLKILESMAAGVPVISTTIGAEGIDGKHNEHYLIADTPEEMVQSLEQLIRHPDERQRLRETGRELAVTRYDWSVLGKQLFELHSGLQEKRSASAVRAQLM
jgi:glycosyltransferase involved in cell wall biosynthesis